MYYSTKAGIFQSSPQLTTAACANYQRALAARVLLVPLIALLTFAVFDSQWIHQSICGYQWVI